MHSEKEEDEDEEEKHDDDDDDDNTILLHKRSSIHLESLKSLVKQTPADMDPIEYIKMCRNILKFNRNIVMTANIYSLDFQLVVSQNIQQVVEKKHNKPTTIINKGNIQNIEIIDDEISNSKSINNTATGTNYWTFEQYKSPNIRNQWVDVWLFARDYTFNLNDINNDKG
eukprot:297544_1